MYVPTYWEKYKVKFSFTQFARTTHLWISLQVQKQKKLHFLDRARLSIINIKRQKVQIFTRLQQSL